MSIKLAIKCQFIFKHSLPLNCFANNLKYKVKLFREISRYRYKIYILANRSKNLQPIRRKSYRLCLYNKLYRLESETNI